MPAAIRSVHYVVSVLKRVCLFLLAAAITVLAPASLAGAQSSDGPSEVYVGAYINDVKDVDLTSNSFSVDLYVWFRWTDPDINPAVSVDPVNPKDAWLLETPLYDEPVQLSDGSYYTIVRYLGGFTTKLPVEDYPFDRQVLTVMLEESSLTSDDLVFIPDPESETMSNPDLVLPGWNWDTPQLTVTNTPYPGNWGNIDQVGGEAYSRVTLELEVHRPAATSAIKMFFPLVLVLLTGVLTFYLRPSMVESKISIAITALLTLVALQFTVMGSLPSVGYLTMIELIYAVSYMFVLFTLGISIYTVWSKRDPESPEAIRFDRKSMIYGFSGYLVLMAITLLAYLI